jgi:hypothetical protein
MELYIEQPRLTRNAKNGRILPGHVPANKGKKWGQYKVPKKSRKKILANLTNEGRKLGALASKPIRCIKIVGIKNGEFFGMFESAAMAEILLKAKGMQLSATNIRHCCKGKRKSAGSVQWFYETDFEKWNKLIVDTSTTLSNPS